jgi:NAD(P)-dependent dehydrogenase (short-subunit alcohol dehydrogenase family)
MWMNGEKRLRYISFSVFPRESFTIANSTITSQINVKGNYVLARVFLPYKKSGGTIVAYSSGFGFLPPRLPFLAKNSAYSTSKMATARFYEFLAVEHPDLSAFIVQPGVVKTTLYEKGELQLDNTIDTGKDNYSPL